MALIEKLGSFYLGKEYDLATKKVLDRPLNYDSRDLTTHGVCVGMTGSGKTGLCIGLLEEAAIDGVPAIIIDPKGDITNLLLTFPDLKPEDFRPWINEDDALRKGLPPDEYAAKTAENWRDGLAGWDEGPDRIRMLKDAADFAIYTPGSEAGLPVSVLSSLQAPKLDWDTEAETLRDKIQGTVSALLGLAGIEADPVRSREHILLSTILETAWRGGEDVDLGKLILAVQKPPFRQLGVFDLESFYPEKERFALAMALNAIVASPSFASWLKGEPLDIPSLLHTPAGKPRHSIFYIAHLNDAERMFFVTILLEQVIAWMRGQPGTTSLRALLYMDEVFGFFPPTANPPSKRPMLTLLKQARAFGVGIMLTTQNPVDIDYKGLSNAGTWFIGKLQAARDKERLLDGLKTVMAEGGGSADTGQLSQIISSLEGRVFLLHDVNLPGPVVFTTRWAMSYLRGPLTRQQIKQLMAPRKAQPAAGGGPPPAAAAAGVSAAPAAVPAIKPAAAPAGQSPSGQPPVLPPGIKQVYLPASLTVAQATRALADRAGAPVQSTQERLVYEPGLLAFASVRIADRKLDVDESRDFSLLLPGADLGHVISWGDAQAVALNPRDVDDRPAAGAVFAAEVPAALADARSIARQGGEVADHLYRNESYHLSYNPTLKLYAKAGESARDFSVRCQQAGREARDAAVDKLREKYATQLRRLEERMAREERDLEDSRREYKGRQTEEMLSGVASLAGALGILGGRRSGLRGFSATASKHRMTSSAKADMQESEAAIARLQADVDEIKRQMRADTDALTKQFDTAAADIQQIKIAPRKTDVQVQLVALAWAPSWEITYEDVRGRARTDSVPAYARPAGS